MTEAAPPTPQPGYRSQRRQTAPIGGGLSVPTIAVIEFLAASVVALIDAYLGNGIGWLFTIGFALITLYCALRVRRADVWWAAILAPLAYAVAILTVSLLGPGATGGLVERVAGITFLLADHAPALFVAVATAVVVGVIRRVVAARR